MAISGYSLQNVCRRKEKEEVRDILWPGVGAEVVKINAEQRMVGIRLTTGGPLSEEYLASKAEKETAAASA